MSRGGRPLELPGLYWDEEKQRYFPIASKPKVDVVHEKLGVKDVKQAAFSKRQRPSELRTPPAKMLRDMRRGVLSYSGLAHTNQYALLKLSIVEEVSTFVQYDARECSRPFFPRTKADYSTVLLVQ